LFPREAARSTGRAGHAGASGIGARCSDVNVPVEEMEAAGVDVAQLDSVELLLAGSGTLLVDNLRFE
jgi:hypothetical protein